MAGKLGGIAVELSLGTAGFDGPMKKSEEVATATSRAIAQAARKSAEAQAFAAKFAGDAITEQSLRVVTAYKVQQVAAADMRRAQSLAKAGYVDESTSANLLAANLQRLTAAKAAVAAASEVEAVATHAVVSQQQAASAAVRSMEGNPGIRAVERFLITIPGVGEALKNIFPLIGALAFAGIIVKMGVDLYELEQKGKHAGEEIGRAFAETTTKLAMSNDELELANSKLDDQIAKLEKRPTNGAATALLEAVVAADKLQTSLTADVKLLEQLMKEHSVSAIEGLLSGVASTGGTNKEITEQAKAVEKSGNEARIAYRQQMAAAGEDQKKQEDASRAYYQRIDAIAADAARKMRARATEIAQNQRGMDRAVAAANAGGAGTGSGTAIDLSPQRESFEGAAEIFDEAQRRAQDEGDSFTKNKRKNQLEGAKAGQLEANQAAELKLKAMDAELASEKLIHSMSLKEVYSFWDARRNAFQAGSAQYNAVVEKQAQLAVESASKAHEQISKYTSAAKAENGRDAFALPDILARAEEAFRRGAIKDSGERNQGYVDTNQLDNVRAHNAAREAEAKIMDDAGRSMTRYAAAVELAKVHEQEFSVVMLGLEGILHARQMQQAADPSKETNRAVEEAQAAIAQEQSRRQIQGRGDLDAIYGRQTSAIVGATDALDEFIKTVNDSGAQAQRLVTTALGGFNSEVVKAMSGQRTSFGNFGAGLARSVAGAGLEKAEGSVLSMLGLGHGKKPTGAPGDPLSVVIANASSLGGAAGSIMSKVAGGGGEGGGIGSSIVGAALGMLPGFADGGVIPPNTWAMVGERGPEPFFSGRGGTVIPNHKAGTIGGGGGDTHVHVDASGSQDPAAVEAAVARGIAAAAPHLMAGARAQVNEKNSRIALSSRR